MHVIKINMTKEEVFSGLKEVFAMVKPKMDLSNIKVEDNLVVDLRVDSLSMLLLSLAIENKWGIQIDQNVQFVTVENVIDYVCANCKG